MKRCPECYRMMQKMDTEDSWRCGHCNTKWKTVRSGDSDDILTPLAAIAAAEVLGSSDSSPVCDSPSVPDSSDFSGGGGGDFSGGGASGDF